MTLENFISTGDQPSQQKNNAKIKAVKRNYDLVNTMDVRQQRGFHLVLKANQNAATAQNQTKLANQEYEEEILKRDMVLTSKNELVMPELQ